MTRTNKKHQRCYIDGYDLSGYIGTIGEMDWSFDVAAEAALSDSVKNISMGQCSVNLAAWNGFLDNDAAGAFVLATPDAERDVAIAFGINAAPAAGDPCFAWKFKETSYKGEAGSGFVAAMIAFGGASSEGVLTYDKPWGYILHPNGAEIAVNTAIGIDDFGAQTTKGGIFAYHLFSSNGTVTLKAQHAATNLDGSFGDMTGATSGSITAAVAPKHGMVAVSTTLTVERYLRWQLVFGTATTATFFAAFIRKI